MEKPKLQELSCDLANEQDVALNGIFTVIVQLVVAIAFTYIIACLNSSGVYCTAVYINL